VRNFRKLKEIEAKSFHINACCKFLLSRKEGNYFKANETGSFETVKHLAVREYRDVELKLRTF
jgi:hypothetical protein